VTVLRDVTASLPCTDFPFAILSSIGRSNITTPTAL
jgi:hypothetical protein